jgi:hypothetical protein
MATLIQEAMDQDFADNQGCINARISRLLSQPDKLAEYVETLTEAQKSAARSHIKTLRQIENAQIQKES